MGRKTRRSGGSTGSAENDVTTTAPAKESIAESGHRRVLSESSSLKDSPKSFNSPASKSRPKRGSSEFNKPTPKKKSAYAQLLENKQSSNGDDAEKVATSPTKTAKKGKGLREDTTKKTSPSHGEPSSGRPTRNCNAASHGEHSSGRRTRNSKTVGEDVTRTDTPEAHIESVELIELRSNNTSPKKSGLRSDRGTGNASPETQGAAIMVPAGNRATSPKSSIKHSPMLNNQVALNEERLRQLEIERLPQLETDWRPRELETERSMAETNGGTRHSTSSSRIFPLSSANEVVMVLSHPQSVFLRGKAFVRSIQGQVMIHGFVVKPGGVFHPFYSPDCSSLLAVSTIMDASQNVMNASPDVTVASPDPDVIRRSLSNEDSDTVRHVLTAVDSRCVVLIFKRLECRVCSYVASVKPFTQLFSGVTQSDGSVVTPVGTLDLAVVDRLPDTCMNYDDDYRRAVGRFCDDVKEGLAPVVVVCGGKNVGKSTLTRYLINSALNSCGRVAYLECDVGQPEFTPGGCPALCVITEPLLGPPFTHQRTPRKWCYFGAVSPGGQPEQYMRCLRYVYDKYDRMDSKPPLVVNTMGWTQGLGIALMVETVRLVQPTLVIQLDSSRQTKNLPYVTTEFLESDSGFRWTNDEERRNEANKTEHALIVVNSPVRPSLAGHEKYRPKDLRNLMVLAYFGRLQLLQGPLKDISELQPYELPWDAVAVHVCNGAVDNRQVMYQLNASVVALCIADGKTMVRSTNPHYPLFFDRTPICQAVGFGIIRAIDPKKRVFYILTPVPQAQLVKVNCLLRGDLELPEQLLLEQKVKGCHPYVGRPSDVTGASSTKKRRHMFRHRRENTH